MKEAAVLSTLGHRERVACRDGRIDLSHLAAGVYYLEVRTDTGVRREKITKL
ncbi:MAG: T9SS type A sorting domain-containing protein [Bacteroidales bacterium]|nr:T9SS type A sorting domain-containing protein [Bacteroidales bacterium]